MHALHQEKILYFFIDQITQKIEIMQARIRKNKLLPPPQISLKSNPKFLLFLNFYRQKVHFFTGPWKTPEFYPIKNVSTKKRKRYTTFLMYIGPTNKTEWHCQPAPPTPKRLKNDFDFLPFCFFAFLCSAHRDGHFDCLIMPICTQFLPKCEHLYKNQRQVPSALETRLNSFFPLTY